MGICGNGVCICIIRYKDIIGYNGKRVRSMR